MDGDYSAGANRLVLTADTKSFSVECRHHATTNDSGPASRHPRSLDPADAADRPDARVGDLGARSADFARRAADQPGLALPGAASAGAPGLDRRRMAGLGTGTARQVLPPHSVGPAPAGGRSR